MNVLTSAALAGAALLLFLLFFPAIAALFGFLAGWVVSLFWPDTSAAFLQAIGLEEMTLAQLGAMLAFVGSFFRAVQTNKTKSD